MLFSIYKKTVHFHPARSCCFGAFDRLAFSFRIVHHSLHFRWTSKNDSFDCLLFILRAINFRRFWPTSFKIVQFSPFIMASFKDFRTVNFCRCSSFKSLRPPSLIVDRPIWVVLAETLSLIDRPFLTSSVHLVSVESQRWRHQISEFSYRFQ